MRLSCKLLVLFFVMLALVVPVSEAKNNKKKRQNNVEKANNQRFKGLYEQARLSTECRGLAVEELHSQCASYKVSPECFVQHYGALGLEFGEEDTQKEKRYKECLKASGLLL